MPRHSALDAARDGRTRELVSRLAGTRILLEKLAGELAENTTKVERWYKGHESAQVGKQVGKLEGKEERIGEQSLVSSSTVWYGMAWKKSGVITFARPYRENLRVSGLEGGKLLEQYAALNKRLNIPSINSKRCKISANSIASATRASH